MSHMQRKGLHSTTNKNWTRWTNKNKNKQPACLYIQSMSTVISCNSVNKWYHPTTQGVSIMMMTNNSYCYAIIESDPFEVQNIKILDKVFFLMSTRAKICFAKYKAVVFCLFDE